LRASHGYTAEPSQLGTTAGLSFEVDKGNPIMYRLQISLALIPKALSAYTSVVFRVKFATFAIAKLLNSSPSIGQIESVIGIPPHTLGLIILTA
jgi:hypothetical protein